MVAIVALLFISTNTELVYFFGEEAPLPWTCHRHRPFFRSQSWVKSTTTTTSCNKVGIAFSTIVTCGCKTKNNPKNPYFLTYFRGVGVTSKETVIPSVGAPEPQALLTFTCAPPRLVARAGICELRLQNPYLPQTKSNRTHFLPHFPGLRVTSKNRPSDCEQLPNLEVFRHSLLHPPKFVAPAVNCELRLHNP